MVTAVLRPETLFTLSPKVPLLLPWFDIYFLINRQPLHILWIKPKKFDGKLSHASVIRMLFLLTGKVSPINFGNQDLRSGTSVWV